MIAACDSVPILPSQNAVSYTNLDVYKRQIHRKPVCGVGGALECISAWSVTGKLRSGSRQYIVTMYFGQ